VYYRFLRQTCLRYILKAEKLIDSVYAENQKQVPISTITDVLLDGQLDGVLENDIYSCFLSTLKGGSIFSLGMKNKGYDFQNVLKRHREAYHPKEMGVIQDDIEKWSFQDHFFTEKHEIEKLSKNNYEDIGNFANRMYKIAQGKKNTILMERTADLTIQGIKIEATVKKEFQINKSKLLVNYSIDVPLVAEIDTLFFSPEINFIGASYPYKTYGMVNEEQFDLKDDFIEEKCNLIGIYDNNELEKAALEISFQPPITCGSHPIISLLKSELGFEKQYQGTSIFPFFEITKPKEIFEIQIVMKSL
jgi:hypothetical protein